MHQTKQKTFPASWTRSRVSHGFTLVELIVVITILAILGTIAFISLQGFAKDARESARLNDVKLIGKKLGLYKLENGKVPLPDDSIDITGSGSLFGKQGYAGQGVLSSIEQVGDIVDPLLDVPYTYYVNAAATQFQLLAFFEENTLANNELNLGDRAYANTTYADMFPKTYGNSLGVLIDSNNEPVQNDVSLGGELDLNDVGTDSYSAILSGDEIIAGNGTSLRASSPVASCNRIKQSRVEAEDGLYMIDPLADGIGFNVYCDMTTDGGGWIAATMLADPSTRNLFDTGNSSKIESITENISTKGSISDVWIDDRAKDIMLKCEVNEDLFKNYKEPFIIQGYLKSDIDNLTKFSKGGSVFSSISLAAKYNGEIIPLLQNYGASLGSSSLYIRVENSDPCYALLVQTRIAIADSSDSRCPQFTNEIVGNTTSSTFANDGNFCMSFIR